MRPTASSWLIRSELRSVRTYMYKRSFSLGLSLCLSVSVSVSLLYMPSLRLIWTFSKNLFFSAGVWFRRGVFI